MSAIMPPELFAAYCAAAAVLLAIPGPTIMLVVGCALAGGRRTAWYTVPGVALGDSLAMTLSLAGLGAVLAASGTLFMLLKWAGGLYLIYLGVSTWMSTRRRKAGADQPAGPKPACPIPARRGRELFGRAFLVTATNPKSIAFFVAFLPQFVSHAHPVLPQFVLMGVVFVTLAMVNAAAYAWLAGSARQALSSPRAQRIMSRTGGSVLIGAGLATVALDPPS